MQRKGSWSLDALAATQLAFGTWSLARMARSLGGARVEPMRLAPVTAARMAVLVPVLNERERLAPCLDSLLTQSDEVAEILVIDGGSDDGTRELVRRYEAADTRVRLVDASPIPDGWNGKAWGLSVGLEHASPKCVWILTIDADVRVSPLLARSLLAHAKKRHAVAFSVATHQALADEAQGLLHPAMLATLVYRFGAPGREIRSVGEAQANGQCFLVRRALLDAIGGFHSVRDSICEDVTLARALIDRGVPVGFYEAGDLAWARMYESGADLWRNWPRSLPMRDRYVGPLAFLLLLQALLTQALPLPFTLYLLLTRRTGLALGVNGALLVARLGVLAGTARAYRRRPWTYWLSPLADLPVVLEISRRALQRRHLWRGRTLAQGGASLAAPRAVSGGQR